MINRGKLRRDIEKGHYEARTGFFIGYDDPTRDKFGSKNDKFFPARVSKGFGDFKEGFFNIPEHSFKSKSGSAYLDKEGFINFGGHSNENILLRKRKR